jgi:hypothetical protein
MGYTARCLGGHSPHRAGWALDEPVRVVIDPNVAGVTLHGVEPDSLEARVTSLEAQVRVAADQPGASGTLHTSTAS